MNTQTSLLNSVLVYLLLFVSGSMRSILASNKYLVVSFLLALIAWWLFSDRKISEKFLLYAIAFMGFLFLLSLYTGGSLSVGSVISSTMRFVLAYLILRTVGASFVDTYIKVVVFLAAISLFGYVSDTLHLFDGLVLKLPAVGQLGYEGMLYMFRHAWHPYRNNSIFFEPGAYQGFLNAALFLIFFVRTEIGGKQKWTYIVLLLAALVTTFSTTGFVILGLNFALFLYRSEIISFSGKVILTALMMASVGMFAGQFHSAVVVKLSDYLNPQEDLRGYSATGRSYDARTDLRIVKEHVFGLGHEKYAREFKAIAVTIGEESDKWTTSSNGVTSLMAVYGLPFSLFMFVSYYWALRRLLGDALLATTAFVMFIMFLWGEAYFSISSISFAIIAAAFVFPGLSVTEKSLPETESPRVS